MADIIEHSCMHTEWFYELASQSSSRSDLPQMRRIATEFQDKEDHIHLFARPCWHKEKWISRHFGRHCNSSGWQINVPNWHTPSPHRPPQVQDAAIIKIHTACTEDNTYKRQPLSQHTTTPWAPYSLANLLKWGSVTTYGHVQHLLMIII